MIRTIIRLIVVLAFLPSVAGDAHARQQHVTPEIRIASARIIEAALADSGAYDRLAYMADTFGPRFSGSENLELAIDWILDEMQSDGLENVHGEGVMVPRWVRGEESLQLLEPRSTSLEVLALGGSVGTGPEGVTGEVIVVKSFEELSGRQDEARGKIVLFNAAFTSYGQTVQYRRSGAVHAARAGAIASLIRSVGPASMYTPHTGSSTYEDSVPKIPHAAITIEDAMMMQRMHDRGQKIVVRLNLGAQTFPDSPSRNVVAEIVGREFPDEVVILGGHIDSWDVGQGAMDDGGGCVAAWEAVRLLLDLGLRPRRTVRVVMWTNEENGLRGGNGYRDAHLEEVDQMVLAIESDGGVFKPRGFGFGGGSAGFEVVTEIGQLLEPIEAGQITRGGGGADIGPLMNLGVPGMGLAVDGTEYFWYHHTPADTMDKLDPHEMNLSVAAMAVMAYAAAELQERIPRD